MKNTKKITNLITREEWGEQKRKNFNKLYQIVSKWRDDNDE